MSDDEIKKAESEEQHKELIKRVADDLQALVFAVRGDKLACMAFVAIDKKGQYRSVQLVTPGECFRILGAVESMKEDLLSFVPPSCNCEDRDFHEHDDKE